MPFTKISKLFKVSINFGVYEHIMRQLFMQNMVSKMEWKRCIWKKAWDLEDSFWDRQIFLQKKCQFLVKTVQHPRYLTWWYLSDLHPDLMYQCEDMAKLVCNASKLKADDVNFRHSTYYMRTCIECNMSVIENVEHIVMQCPSLDQSRRNMYDEILELANDLGTRLLEDPSQTMLLLMGKSDNRFDIEHLVMFWSISARHISKMYRQVVKNRLELTGKSRHFPPMTCHGYTSACLFFTVLFFFRFHALHVSQIIKKISTSGSSDVLYASDCFFLSVFLVFFTFFCSWCLLSS